MLSTKTVINIEWDYVTRGGFNLGFGVLGSRTILQSVNPGIGKVIPGLVIT